MTDETERATGVVTLQKGGGAIMLCNAAKKPSKSFPQEQRERYSDPGKTRLVVRTEATLSGGQVGPGG